MTITFRSATEEDARYVGENLRAVDHLELQRGGNEAPSESPLKSLRASLIAWTMCRGSLPIAVFGVAAHKAEAGTGIVWFLGTEEVSSAPVAMVRGGRYYVSLMQRLFRRLVNAVDSENVTTRGWLAALGFHEAGEVSLSGHPFVVVVRDV